MPAKIVLVNEDAAFRGAVSKELHREGLDDVAEFSDALAAMAALAEARRIELLITAIDFSLGRSNGASLVRMVRSRKPTVAAILVGKTELHPLVEDLGVCVPSEIEPSELISLALEQLRRPELQD